MGTIEKELEPNELALFFRAAFLSEQTLRETRPYDNPVFQILSNREKDVLTYLMAGEPNKRVASLLDIGLRTVESDRAQLMSKLKVNSFTELVKMVTEIENDLILTRQKIFCDISQGMATSNVAFTAE
jgi:FixJ family two-component response regulator